MVANEKKNAKGIDNLNLDNPLVVPFAFGQMGEDVLSMCVWARDELDRHQLIAAPTTTSSMHCEDGWKWYTFLRTTKVVSFQCSQEAGSREKIVYTSSKAFLPLPLFLPKNISEWLIVLAEASLWSETIFTMPNEKAK